jgi:hypothetical protein
MQVLCQEEKHVVQVDFFYCCMNFHDAFPEVHFRWVYSSDNLDCSFLMTGELCHVIAMFTGAVSHKLLRRFSGTVDVVTLQIEQAAWGMRISSLFSRE